MWNDLRNKVVLITGGTMGIGLATGLAFGRQGARCVLTHRWGSADEDEVRARFTDAGAPAPLIVEADVAHDGDTAELMATLAGEFDGIEAFVSNVAFAPVIHGLDQLRRRDLLRAVDYTAWPLVGYTLAIHETFGRWPRYVVGLSSMGHREFHANYDFVAASKAALESLCRYMATRLMDDGVRVNVVQARFVRTASLEATVGPEFAPFLERYPTPGQFVEPDEVADAVLALCSGMMDGLSGQVLTVDHGGGFSDNLMRLYAERHELGLVPVDMKHRITEED